MAGLEVTTAATASSSSAALTSNFDGVPLEGGDVTS
eukprot:CAMPEP_0174732886 /NCGR_PEP_ID=MMETSP1094-20130205/60194_1 /TAXON_ID=156173 /ORGANISM="Chrysochromulina brevifilum, Strain UTEX LB 985" /LENGTH=35 /DNA_ID= /DNA_START= /DNA_END= /DNA_ORIENTATION=